MEVMSGVICLMIPAVFIVSCIYFILEQSKEWKKEIKYRKEDKAKGIVRYTPLIHVSGLEAVEGSECTAMVTPSDLVLVCMGKEYTLPLNRISYVTCNENIQEERYVTSSTAKGVAGAAVFGVNGAIIGSAPSTRTRLQTQDRAVIVYRSARRKESVIVLRDVPPNRVRCSALIDTLRSRIQIRTEKVQL